MSLGSLVLGAALPYLAIGIAVGVRKKSIKAGAMVAWGMAGITVGMFSKHLEINVDGEDDGGK